MATNVEMYQVFLSSRFDEFGELRKKVTDRQQVVLTMHVTFGDLDDGAARSAPPSKESIKRAANADVVILIIGETYGRPPPGFDKSYIHLEFEAAQSGRVLAYKAVSRNPSGLPEDPRLTDFVSEVESSCTLASLDLANLNRAADRILVDLRDLLADIEDATEQASPAGPRAAQLGREIVATASNEWRDDRIGPLDRRVIGEPMERQATLDSVNLVGRTDHEWNEACKAFKIGSADLTIEHLKRALDLRPLDGEAQYWIARLQFGAPEGAVKYEEVADSAAVAAASLFQQNRKDLAGLAHLVEAKALRKSSDHEKGLVAATRSVSVLGDEYFEPNLELAYHAIATDDLTQALTATRRAFIISPPCLGPAAKQYRTLKGGSHILDDFKSRLVEEADRQVVEMYEFGRALFAHTEEIAWTTRSRRSDLNDDFDRLGLKPRPLFNYDRSAANDQRTSAHELSSPVEYTRERSDEPAAVVRDGVSKATENLERLRDLENLLQQSAAIVRDARVLRFNVVDHDRSLATLRNWLWGVPVAVATAFGLLTDSWQLAVIGLAVLSLVVGFHLVVERRRTTSRRQAAARRVAGAAQAWLSEASKFRDLVHEYERIHLIWPSYGPRSIYPDYVDYEAGLRLYVRRYATGETEGPEVDLDPLAPDFRELAASIQGPFGRVGGEEMDADLVVGDVQASALLEAGSPSEHKLLGRVERRTKPAKLVSVARWAAYRRAGTGPTVLDGSRGVARPWSV